MTIRQSVYAQTAILAGTCAYSAYMSTILPDHVPTHWNAQGQVDAMGSKWVNLAMGPCLVLAMLALTLILPAISPKHFTIDRFGATYGKLMVIVSMLMAFIQVVILQASTNSGFDITKAMMGGIFLFFALMGNLMGKVKRNFFVGIRTPWTLADERVWDQTHREAAYLWFVGGLVGMILALVGMPIVGSIALLLVLAFVPVIKSYVIYKRLAV